MPELLLYSSNAEGGADEVRYDAETDALYVSFSDGAVVEMRPGIMVDLDADGRIIAIELLDASEHLAPASDLKLIAAWRVSASI